MKIMDFPGAERIGAPAGWDPDLDGPCAALPAIIVPDLQTGLNCAYSIWKPSDDELALLAAGGAIRLGVLGTGPLGGGHPVVNMCVMKPEAISEAGCVEVEWA